MVVANGRWGEGREANFLELGCEFYTHGHHMVLKRSRNTLVAAAGAGEWNVQFYVEERQMGQWSCVSTRFMYR